MPADLTISPDATNAFDALGENADPSLVAPSSANPSSTATSSDVLLRLGDGDEQAFAEVYDRYSPRIFGSILKLVKDRNVAEDLLQDVFVKVWHKRAEIDPARSFTSFLFTVARNQVYNYMRRASLEVQVAAYITAQTSESYQHVEEQVHYSESEKAIWEAIDRLPSRRKLVYIRCKIEGRSYDEVAEELGVTVAAVNAHIVKATKAIKAHLRLNDSAILLAVWTAFMT